jgi:hypothetical protein
MSGYGRRTASAPRADLSIVAEVEKLLGTCSDPSEVTRRLKRAKELGHLIASAPQVGAIPEGTGVALSMVLLDPEKDCYVPKGSSGNAPLKHALNLIALGAGLSWLPKLCGRTDDGKTALYWSWKSAGEVALLGGRKVVLVGSSELDLRVGGETRREIEERQIEKARGDNVVARDAIQREIRGILARPMALLETKTMNRAIRTLGLKQSYTTAELAKPFVIARHEYTGRFQDPEMQKEAHRALIESHLGARGRAYGDDPDLPDVIEVRSEEPRQEPQEPPEAPEAPSPAPEPASAAVPPGTRLPDEDEAPPEDEGDGFDPDRPPPMEWTNKQGQVKAFMLPERGSQPAVRVADATPQDSERLNYWIDRLVTDFENDEIEHKFRKYSEAKLAAMSWKLRSFEPW